MSSDGIVYIIHDGPGAWTETDDIQVAAEAALDGHEVHATRDREILDGNDPTVTTD